ncbi:MAG: hypothetical protein KGQ66_11790 [Acidobacteriota bacterium]|nr:hypothetical protein [Acidobacteriota bacterium]
MPPEVVSRLDRYRPACLSGPHWALAGPGVRAVVLAAFPTDAEDAKGLVSRLCLFLAGPCGWDRRAAPDLAGLLGEAGIAAHLDRLRASGKAGKTRENHRADLRRLARAVGGMPPGQPAPSRPTPPAPGGRAELLGAWNGPLTALAAAWEQRAGRPLRREDLGPVVASLVGRTAPCASPEAPGTMPSSPVAAVLAAAADAVTTRGEVAANSVVSSRAGAGAPGRSGGLSRAAALRQAKAAMAAAGQPAGPRLADAPDLAAMDPKLAEAIVSYRPKRIPAGRWAPMAGVCQRLVAGYQPPSVEVAKNVGSMVARFVEWAAARPGRPTPAAPAAPLALEELLDVGLVDTYDAHLAAAGVPDGSRATRRSVLRRALRSLDATERPAPIAYQPVAGPYTAAECAAFVRLARHQPSPARRRELSFVVGLGLGAGLDGRDLRHVARDSFADVDLGETSPGLVVTVAGGDRPRSVVVRRAYEPLVREALASHDAARRGRTASILGRSQSRRNITTPVMEHAVTARATETVAIEVNRLRATWLVAAMCAPIPLGVLLAAAGLRSARSLCDLLSHCPAPDPAVVAAALAHLDHAGIGQGQDRP